MASTSDANPKEIFRLSQMYQIFVTITVLLPKPKKRSLAPYYWIKES